MYNRYRRRKTFLGRIYSFAVSWAVLSFFFPLYRLDGLLGVAAISAAIAFFVGRAAGRAEKSDSNPVADTKRTSERTGAAPSSGKKKEEYSEEKPPEKKVRKKSYGPEIDPIVDEGNRALSEMGRLYMSIRDTEVRSKINEIMRITDKITQDAVEDPSDIPQIRKFFRYYLPTTIKLLNAYDRMASQEIDGENIDRTMKNINEMLDVAIEAYKKRLDSLFENQALDIETDIDVMNQMLAREGLTGDREFITGTETNGNTAAAYAVKKQKG